MVNTKFKNKISVTFRALHHRNFKLFFSGQCISLIGTWIQQIAINWLVYRLTHSALLMGIIVFVGTFPSIIIAPFAGVLIDRINKYHALIIVQSMFMIEAFIFAALTLSGIIQVWHVMVLCVLIGITNAIDMPLRQSFVVHLVDGSTDLSNAISLNSSSFNLARLIGPAVAGVLIASVGEGICFLLNALSYISVIWALFIMDIKNTKNEKKEDKNIIQELKEGVNYTLNSLQIRNVILYLAMASLLGMFYPLLMPIYAKEILHGGAQTLGFLMSSSGIGALLGALYLAGRRSVKGQEKWICIASLSFGLGLLGLNFTNKMFAALILLFLIGFGMVIIIATCNTLIQHYVDDDKRGRVMSLYTMAFMGTAPIGSLCSGAIAQKIGVPHTFLLSGITMLIAAYIFSTKLKYFSYIPEIETVTKEQALVN